LSAGRNSSFSAQKSKILSFAQGMEQGIAGIPHLSISKRCTYTLFFFERAIHCRELAGNPGLNCRLTLDWVVTVTIFFVTAGVFVFDLRPKVRESGIQLKQLLS
jgi:hypothetical protein